MNWRERMAPAKFRGVSFGVETSALAGGRKGTLHEYPFKDDGFFEDMGSKTRSFAVQGFVIGDDYLAKKDALIKALDTAGTGELVHPHYGTLRVVAQSFTVQESSDGGVARFAIEFVRSGKRAQPSSVVDAAGKLKATASISIAAISAEFLRNYSPGALLGSVTGAIASASRAVNGALSTVQMGAEALADLKRQVGEFANNASALAQQPANLLSAQVDLFAALADGMIEVVGSLDQVSPVLRLLALYSFDAGTRPPATTSARAVEQRNFDANKYLTQRLIVVHAARLASELEFPSYDDALIAREAITALIDNQADVVADDIYPALLQLRADLVAAVPGDALEIARLVAYTPQATLPSLVLAHRLYGHLTLEADLISRNKIANPGFVRGGTVLEVLSLA